MPEEAGSINTGRGDGRGLSDEDQFELGGQRHLASFLMRDSLLSQATRLRTSTDVVPLLPFVKVIKLGGRSIIDHGAERLRPVLDELEQAMSSHKIVIGVGGGARSRHVFGVGLDLGLPTGVLAALSATDAEENAHIVAALLARFGVVSLPPPLVTHLLPALLALGNGVVVNGVPPFELWEHPPEVGRIPPNRTDVGMYLLGEICGVDRVILVKDVDGVYSADPKASPGARRFDRVTVQELKERRPPTLPFDELLLELLPLGRHCRTVQLIDGTLPGTLTRALQGEHVGTIIEAPQTQAAREPARAAVEKG
jgi:molybdenum storage protein